MITKVIPNLSTVVRASVNMDWNLVVALCEVGRVPMTPVMGNVALHLVNL